MAEAEAVLLEAAERATAAMRARWARGRGAEASRGLALAAMRRSLQVLVGACFGIEPPLVATDAPPPPGVLARRLGGLAPWRRRPAAPAFTDGVRIHLPRVVTLEHGEAHARALLRATALGLAGRIVRGSPSWCPREPLARDLFWIADGAACERWLAAELPGLAPELSRLRRSALAARPAWNELRPAECRVEAFARSLLQGDVSVLGGAVAPASLAGWAKERAAREPGAARYRGLAPVAHWGSARPELAADPARRDTATLSGVDGDRLGRPPSQRLERRIEPRLEEDREDGASPILLASEDGHLAVQDPAGLRRPRDRDREAAELETLAGELARLPELARVREPGPVAEILADDEATPATGAGAAERPPDGIVYPEWDWRARAYRPAYCVVREAAAPDGDPAWIEAARREHAALFVRVRRLFDALRPRRERQRRRLDGDDLDLDAVVADHADRRAGLAGSDRLYTAQHPNRRDVAVSFLVDASGSTESRLAGGRSVLEVAQAATLVLGEALRVLGDRHAIHAFSGAGARGVRVLRIKGFGEEPGVAALRIAGLAPDRFTRLGAPLRHLSAALAGEGVRRRLLLLLSDGKPNDEDEYEGRYGVEDTRQAVVEARALGIDVFCLTIDRDGSSYLPRMFGPWGYAVLSDVRQLPERLVDLYRRLTVRV